MGGMRVKTAWAFPGQGTENLELARVLLGRYAVAAETFDRADRLIDPPLTDFVFGRRAGLLARPAYSQLSIFTLSIALQRILAQKGHAPHAVMGHSMGEVSALVTAGALSFDRAFTFLRRRAELMEEATPPGAGAMAAVHDLRLPEVRRLCAEVRRSGETLRVASVNAENQVVLAGSAKAIDRALVGAERAGAGVVPLDMEIPVHCDLMRPISDALRKEFGHDRVADPAVPVISSVSGAVVTTGEKAESLLHAQLHRPILWTASVRAAVEMGIERVVEVGPGRALLGLFKRNDRRIARVHAEELIMGVVPRSSRRRRRDRPRDPRGDRRPEGTTRRLET